MRQFNIDTTTEEVKDASLSVEAKPYIAIIRYVTDNFEKEYLNIYFDLLTKNELNQAFSKEAGNNLQVWNRKGKYAITYKEQWERLFGAFITAIERSNQGYKWDWNPQSLVGKKMVVVYREEEFLTKTNEIKTTISPGAIRSTLALQKHEIKPLPLKKLSNSKNPTKQRQASFALNQPTFVPTSSGDMQALQQPKYNNGQVPQFDMGIDDDESLPWE